MGFGQPLRRWRNPSRRGPWLERKDAGRQLAAGILSVWAVVWRRVRVRKEWRIVIGHAYRPASMGRMS